VRQSLPETLIYCYKMHLKLISLSLMVVPCALTGTIFNDQGAIDPERYALEARSWDATAIAARLGPDFAQLQPEAEDDRPTLYQQSPKPLPGGFARINPWELGEAPAPDGDYWSESGQVGYVPDEPDTNTGLDRIAVYAYNSKVFALSPRLDWASGKPRSDPQTRNANYVAINGTVPMQPVGMARGSGLTQNEALVIYRDGLLGVAGTQTSRAGHHRPYPSLKFPKNKVPTAIAISTSNEFALITIWDTDTLTGQLAVVALEGKYLPVHTMPYMGLPNQGSWSDIKLLGYVDLPMAAPSAVSVASNGYWKGPSATSGKNMGALKLTDDAIRDMLYKGGVIAKGGYAIVASKHENKVAIVDLTRLFAHMRKSYLSSASAYNATMANRGPAPDQFPQAFSALKTHVPEVVWQAKFTSPTAVLAGHRIDRWSTDHFKAYVATENGTIHIIDTSALMARSSWHTRGALAEIGSFKVGANPVSMFFARRADQGLPLIPVKSNSGYADCFNAVFWVACRGDRSIQAVHTYRGQGAVHMVIRDQRMGDPVAVSTAVRGPIVTVADFAGKKILSFRIGPIVDVRNKVTYGAGATGTDKFEFAGELALPGRPFMVGSANVN
jgi:hypothetical protein